jgi:hypothetical protein
MHWQLSSENIRPGKQITMELHPSIPRDDDEYDELGRNMTAQKRREVLYGVWKKVKKSKKGFY